MSDTVPVSVVIPVMDPNLDHLNRTVSSFAAQTAVPSEVVIVDSSDEPLRPHGDAPFDIRVVHAPELGIGAARWRGIREASNPIVAHFDEDAVLVSEDYIERALEKLAEPGVSCVGGETRPIRGNPDGLAFSLLQRHNPSQLGTHNILHKKHLCDGHSRCFVPGRGEDITIREELLRHGRMERLDVIAEKDTPTSRQTDFQTILLASLIGGMGSAVGSALVSYLVERAT